MKNIIIALLLISLTSCAQSQTNNKQKKEIPGWKSYDGKNYTLQYPPSWELNTEGQLGAEFFLFTKMEGDQDQFRENVNLIVQDLTGHDMSLDDFTSLSEEQVKTMIANSAVVESKRVKDGSPEYHKIIFTGEQGQYKLKFLQYYWIQSKKAYILTFTTEQNKYDTFKEEGENIMNSFSFK